MRATIQTMAKGRPSTAGLALALVLFSSGVQAAPGSFREPMWSKLVPKEERAAEYVVAVNGKANNAGSERSPWDLASVVGGKQKIRPGSIVWVRGGTYIHPIRDSKEGGNGFSVSLGGAEGKPIHLRAWPGERATLDGGFEIKASYLWIWDLEFAISDDWRPKEPAPEGSNTRFKTPTGVINIAGGSDIKLINCISRNNHMGVGFWKSVQNGEMHGCVIFDNGFLGADRPHGPALYTQNETRTPRLISDNIMAGNFSLPFQCYGSKIDQMVNDFRIEGNICFAPRAEARGRDYLLFGGENSMNMTIRSNVVDGYVFKLGRQSNQLAENNTLVRGEWAAPSPEKNTLIQNPGSGSKPVFLLRPNKYDPRRANLVVSNWNLADRVVADLGGFLKSGDHFRVLSPFDFYGKPLLEGIYTGKPLKLPLPAIPWSVMRGDPRELGVYIVMKISQ